MSLTKYVFLDNIVDAPICDIGILFGGVEMIPNRADAAIKLYKEKRIKKILVTGGIGYFSKVRNETEANMLYNYLTNNGVNVKDILIENKSKNTHQNVKNSFSLLDSSYNIDKLRILLITSDFHLKRCLYLTKTIIKNNNNIYGYPVVSECASRFNYYKTFKGKKIIITEAFLLFLTKLKK